MPQTVGSPFLWTSFLAGIVVMLAIDLGVFHRKAHEVKFKEALSWVGVWIALAALFNLWIFHRFGSKTGLEFLTGYVIEYALSVDNIFVFVVILAYFRVPKEEQHHVIFWGVLGALIMRAIFVFAGTALLHRFEWLIYVFGGFLIFTGIKTMQGRLEGHDPSKGIGVRLATKWLRFTPEFHGSKFLTRVDGKLFGTPLLMVLIVIEFTDLVFAVDSVPAVLAVTSDPFIVFTSNIFAILGLRSLYFVLAGAMGKIHYLKLGLGLVLTFVGIKMTIVSFYRIPIGISLSVVVGILATAVVASLIRKRRTFPN